MTRQERERLVLDLYNQGKTIREIAKEVRMSFRDIGVILNKAVEEKAEGLKEQHEEIQQLSVSSQAYKPFSEHKAPSEVAIALNLKESEATIFYKEYWKLKQLHNLTLIYEETKCDIDPFLKLYRLSKAAGMNVQQVSRHNIVMLDTNLLEVSIAAIRCKKYHVRK
jgi:transposase